MSIDARIRLLIEKSGMNAKAFAQSLGMPYTSLHGYMKGVREPGASAIEKICSQLSIDANWLLTGEGAMQRTQTDVCNIPLDAELLSDIIEVLEDMCASEGISLSARKKAEVIFLLYDYFLADKKVERPTVARFLRLVA